MSNLVGIPLAASVPWYDSMTDSDVWLDLHNAEIPGGTAYTGGLATGDSFKVSTLGYVAIEFGTDENAAGLIGVSDLFEVQAVVGVAAAATNTWGISGRVSAFPHSQRVRFVAVYVGANTVNLRLEYNASVTLQANYAWTLATTKKRMRMVFAGSTVACYLADADGANEAQIGTTQTLTTDWNDASHVHAGFGGRTYIGNTLDDFLVRANLAAGATTTDLIATGTLTGTTTTGDWFTVNGETGTPTHVVTGGPYSVAGPYAFGSIVRTVTFSTALASAVARDTAVSFAPVLALSGTSVVDVKTYPSSHPSTRTVAVTDSDQAPGVAGALNDLTASASTWWMTPSLDTTVAPAVLSVAYSSATSLLKGAYTGTVQVASSVANNSSQTVDVTLTVYETLALSASRVTMTESNGGTSAATFGVTDSTSGLTGLTLGPVVYQTPDAWFTASLSGATTPAVVTLTPVPQYLGEIPVNSSGASVPVLCPNSYVTNSAVSALVTFVSVWATPSVGTSGWSDSQGTTTGWSASAATTTSWTRASAGTHPWTPLS